MEVQIQIKKFTPQKTAIDVRVPHKNKYLKFILVFFKSCESQRISNACRELTKQGVSDQQNVGSSPGLDTFVLSNTLIDIIIW